MNNFSHVLFFWGETHPLCLRRFTLDVVRWRWSTCPRAQASSFYQPILSRRVFQVSIHYYNTFLKLKRYFVFCLLRFYLSRTGRGEWLSKP